MARAEAAGILEICVQADHQTDPEWDSIWSADEIRRLVHEARAHGMVVSVMVWPQPNEAVIDGIVDWVPTLIDTGAWALEFDCEGGNWAEKHVRDYTSLHAAGLDLVARCRQQSKGRLYLGANFHTGNLQPTVSKRVDYVAVQGYSRYKESDPIRHWGAAYGPGNAQTRAWKLAEGAGAQFIVMGLASYSQTYPGHRASEAMQVAAESATRTGARWLRYWSAKHVVGPNANKYAARFIRGLA